MKYHFLALEFEPTSFHDECIKDEPVYRVLCPLCIVFPHGGQHLLAVRLVQVCRPSQTLYTGKLPQQHIGLQGKGCYYDIVQYGIYSTTNS